MWQKYCFKKTNDMRVVEDENFIQEKFIRCPECKKLLAYTNNDVTQYYKNLMLFKVIKYPVL